MAFSHQFLGLSGSLRRCILPGVVIAPKLRTNDGEEHSSVKNTDDGSSKEFRYEITLRAIGQALEALAIDSFELLLDGDSFVIYGGANSTQSRGKPSPSRFRLFRSKPQKNKRRGFYISGMRFSESDIRRLDRQGKDIRISGERCPDTNSLAHGMRMIGAHIDKTGVALLAVVRDKGLFTVWHKSRSGGEINQVFTNANLYDLWVHLYKKRAIGPRRTGTTNT